MNYAGPNFADALQKKISFNILFKFSKKNFSPADMNYTHCETEIILFLLVYEIDPRLCSSIKHLGKILYVLFFENT
jgi:hypothetical protein